MTVFQKHVKFLFWFASICVVLGLLAYTYVQGNLRAVVNTAVMVLGAFATVCIIPLSNFIDRANARESPTRHAIVGISFLLFVVLEFVFWPKIFNLPKDPKPKMQLHCEKGYTDMQGKSVLTCTSDD